MVLRVLVLLVAAVLAAGKGGGGGGARGNDDDAPSTTTLRCYRDRKREPIACPDGMALEIVALPPPRFYYRRNPRPVVYNLSLPFAPARAQHGASVGHANIHQCRGAEFQIDETCSPFKIDRLVTSSPEQWANASARGPPHRARFESDLYELSTGVYYIFTHVTVYEPAAANATGAGGEAAALTRYDVALFVDEPIYVMFSRRRMRSIVALACALLGVFLLIFGTVYWIERANYERGAAAASISAMHT